MERRRELFLIGSGMAIAGTALSSVASEARGYQTLQGIRDESVKACEEPYEEEDIHIAEPLYNFNRPLRRWMNEHANVYLILYNEDRLDQLIGDFEARFFPDIDGPRSSQAVWGMGENISTRHAILVDGELWLVARQDILICDSDMQVSPIVTHYFIPERVLTLIHKPDSLTIREWNPR